jgi:hypothetical protein
MRPLGKVSSLLGCALLVLPALLRADVVVGSGIELIPPPADIQLNDLQSNTDLFMFQEKSEFVLPVAIGVDGTIPEDYDFLPTPGGTIAAGTVINSYLVHADPAEPVPVEFLNRQISFTNGETIIGIEILSQTLNNSDPLLEATGTIYPPPAIHWGIEPQVEPDSIDWVGNTLIWNTLTGGGHDSGGEDDIRIITAMSPTGGSVPEPGYLWVSGIGLTFILLIKFLPRISWLRKRAFKN